MNASASKQHARAFHDGVCAQCGLPLKLLPGRDLCAMCADLLWMHAAIEAAQASAPVRLPEAAQPALRYTADRQRIAYTLPDGRDVLVSPAPGAVRIVRWLTTAETSRGGA
jgi:hypothetical protein